MLTDDPLMEARALVLRDLEATGSATPQAVSMLEESVSSRRWWVSHWAEGAAYVVGLVATDVQDAMLDATLRWPICPVCDDDVAHTLHIEPELGDDPHWVCGESAAVVAAVGELTR